MKEKFKELLETTGICVGVFFSVLILNSFLGDESPSVKEFNEPIDNEKKPYRNRLNTDIGIMTENRTWDEVQQQQKMNNACAWGRPECPY